MNQTLKLSFVFLALYTYIVLAVGYIPAFEKLMMQQPVTWITYTSTYGYSLGIITTAAYVLHEYILKLMIKSRKKVEGKQ